MKTFSRPAAQRDKLYITAANAALLALATSAFLAIDISAATAVKMVFRAGELFRPDGF